MKDGDIMDGFYMPILNYFNDQAIENIERDLVESKKNYALIVTDKFLRQTDAYQRVINVFERARISYYVFDEVIANPTTKSVNDGLSLVKDQKPDVIISIGGGSAHDTAKAISIVLANGGCIKDYEGVNKMKVQGVPMVAINTTAGTASEMTYFCIITDEQRKVKMAIVDPKMLPWISINDPKTMMSLPKSLTAATGIDALTHAIEAYLSINATPITDANALYAIKLIKQHLPIVYKDGLNRESRKMMAYAQFLAGMAFSNASLGYVHAIAHQLGGFYNLPHGVCNALLLPYVLEFNGMQLKGSRIGDIYEAFGGKPFNKQNQIATKNLVKAIKEFNHDLDIPKSLKELGVKPKDFLELANNALKDSCALTNPVKTDIHGIVKILEKAYRG